MLVPQFKCAKRVALVKCYLIVVCFVCHHHHIKLHVTVYTSSSQRPCNFGSLNAADHAQLTAEFASLAVVEGLHFRPIRRRTKSVQVVHFLCILIS